LIADAVGNRAFWNATAIPSQMRMIPRYPYPNEMREFAEKIAGWVKQ
jgi:hypothetical protein